MTRLASIAFLLGALMLAQPGAARMHDASFITAAAVEAAGVPATDETSFQSGCMSLSQAVAQAKRQHGGRVVSAETRGKNHVIKVLTRDNKVRTVRYPAC